MAELFTASSVNRGGTIDYEEFIAAMLDSKRVAKRKEAVRRSFEQLDRDKDGYITVNVSTACVGRTCHEDEDEGEALFIDAYMSVRA